jgi:hypothetical protein
MYNKFCRNLFHSVTCSFSKKYVEYDEWDDAFVLNPSLRSKLDKIMMKGELQKPGIGVSINSFSDIPSLTFHPISPLKITIFNIIPKTRWHEKQVSRVDLNQHYRIQQKHSYFFAFISTLLFGLLNKKYEKAFWCLFNRQADFMFVTLFFVW